jgi:16S rRNA (adenine1518-N6/adenine1519-N6)-dimethyltransferase
MVDRSVLQEVIDYASLTSNDNVLEIGAGLGFLTKLLSKECKSVTAIEIDPALIEILHEQLKESTNVEIIQGNVFGSNVSSFNKIVSIPPYQISSDLLVWMLDKVFVRAVLILQKEFADRLVAPVGSEHYSWLPVMTDFYLETELLHRVPKSAFYPPPKVDSAIVRLEPKDSGSPQLRNKQQFQHFLKSMFTERNRKVRNAALIYLKQVSSSSQSKSARTIEKIPFGEKRTRDLTPKEFGVLADALIQ